MAMYFIFQNIVSNHNFNNFNELSVIMGIITSFVNNNDIDFQHVLHSMLKNVS